MKNGPAPPPAAPDADPSGATTFLELLWWLRHPLKVVYGLGFAALTLPLGPEGDRSVRRHPWVSYAVVLLCFAGFQYQLLAEPGAEWEQAHEEIQTATDDFLLEHPCLPAPRDLSDHWRRPDSRELIEKRNRACAESRRRPSREEQRELDALVADLRSVERRHPVWCLCDRPVDWTLVGALGSMFLHAGWFHLLGNLLFFYVVGPFIEDVYGRVWFLALYLGSGLAGSLATSWHDPGSTFFSLGASGAVSGVMGAFLVRFTTRRIRLLSVVSLWTPFLSYRFSLPAWVLLVLWFLANLRGAFSGVGGIGWWAHIGGFIFGVAFALLFKWRRVEEKYVAPDVDRMIAYRAHPALVRAVEMRVQGRYRAARRGVELALAARLDDLDAWRERYEIAVAEGDLAASVDDATRLIGLYAKADEPRLAARLVEDVLDRVGTAIPPRFYLVAGARMEAAGETALAWLLYECLRNRHPDHPGVAVTLVREARVLEREGARDEARERYQAASTHRACSEAVRQVAGEARARLQPDPARVPGPSLAVPKPAVVQA